MMLSRIIAILTLGMLAANGDAELQISLVPERALGSRHPDHLSFDEIEWNADSPWFLKPAPVCRVVERPLDLTRLREEALRRDMIPDHAGMTGPLFENPEDGAFSYITQERPFMAAGGNPRLRHVFFGVMPLNTYERDEHNMAIVEPLATKEESVAMFREWLEIIGFDESEFYKGGDWPGGFEVYALTGRESGTHPVTRENVVAKFGQQLRFIQQIGGLPAFWSGRGGCIQFKIGHGGRFSGLVGCMRAWEKIGEYQVLDRAGIEDALTDGFAWVGQPVVCDRIEIIEVSLTAFHASHREPQIDFPLIYVLRCKLHGGHADGEERTISLPALMQHRHRYGPRPGLTEEELRLRRAIEDFRRNPPKPFEEMTEEELEEFKRRWGARGGAITRRTLKATNDGSVP